MGRTVPYYGQSTRISTGIATRQWKNTATIRLSFCYLGVECRETLALEPTPPNLLYAQRLRGEILNAIGRGTFDYAHYFPRSKRARRFGYATANPFLGEVLTQFLTQIEQTLQPSTIISYQKVCRAHLFPTFARVRIKALTPALIRQWLSGLSLTTKAVRNILTPRVPC